MYRIALLMLAAGLSVGASRCDQDQPDDNGGVIVEGNGAAGAPGGGEGEVCGRSRCAAGTTCCNASCGTCAPPGGGCTKQACEPGPAEGGPPRGPGCGGIAARPCPGVGMCMDDPSDSCDPRRGGADCGGLCSCAVTASCIPGTKFDPSPAVCDCVPSGGGSEPGDPGDPGDPGNPPAPGERCGKVTCAAGQECCNPSCGTCVEPGGACTEQFCGDPEPTPLSCGPNTCAEGEVCCNESCGICTKPGEGCTKQFCNDPGDPEPIPGHPCDLECEAGQHCEYVQVVCVRAPCPPLPECVATPRCGGFAGFTCPGAGMCEDDPSDDCDPQNGGADCGGLCECPIEGLCKDGQVWNSAASACGCEPAGGGSGGDGEQCGTRTCGAGQVCCNASCGICTPPDGACIQIACL